MPPVHDYVIDNSTGANVRSDINGVLQAILTNNSSSSAPSTTAAYMWWADTSAGVLKIRNSANDGWIELLQLDGTLTLEDGSAANPALAFRDDLDTGIYSSAANTFNVTAGGQNRMQLGDITIFNDNGLDVDFKVEGDSNPELFYVDASTDRIGINTSTPNTKLHIIAPNLNTGTINATNCKQLGLWVAADAGNSNTANDIYTGIALGEGHAGMYGFDGGGSAATGLGFFTGNSSSTTERMRIDGAGNVGLGTTHPDSILDLTGSGPRITFNDTAGTNDIAKITGSAGALFLQARDGDSHGEIIFRTENNATALERMRIKNDGDVSINDGNLIVASGHGIDFSAAGNNTNMTSELFDGYEEGTWTPAIGYQNSSGLTIGTNSASGKYTRIGRLVMVIGCVNFSVSGSPVNDNIFVSGLPFNTGTGAVSTGDTRFAGCNVRIQSTSDDTSIYMVGSYGNFAFNLGVQQDMGNRANEIGGNANMVVRVQVWYHTA